MAKDIKAGQDDSPLTSVLPTSSDELCAAIDEMEKHSQLYIDHQRVADSHEQLRHAIEDIAERHRAELMASLDTYLHLPHIALPHSQHVFPAGSSVPPAKNVLVEEQIAPLPNVVVLPHSASQDNLQSRDALPANAPYFDSATKSNKDTLVEKAVASKAKKKKKHGNKHFSDYLFDDAREAAKGQQTSLQKLVSSQFYEWFSGSLIVLNAICIGWQTQFIGERALDNAAAGVAQEHGEPDVFIALGVIFTILFTVELALRWCSEGFLQFFQTREDLWWNVLDIVVVTLGIVDCLVEAAGDSDKPSFTGNFSILRVLRVVRIVRVAKVIRVWPMFRELRTMIFSIMNSINSFLWVILVLLLMFYTFGVVFTVATILHMDTTAKLLDHQDTKEAFGTLDRSILALYMAISGGEDWSKFYRALHPLPFQYRALFLLFIAMTVFAVVNVVTGIFVETARTTTQKDRDRVVTEELRTKRKYLEQLRAVFEEMDVDNSGSLTLVEFEKRLNDEKVIAYFNALKLDVSDARQVFTLLDNDRSLEVSVSEFLAGCYRLQGESRALDVKISQCQVQYLLDAVHDLRADLDPLISRHRPRDDSRRGSLTRDMSSASVLTRDISGTVSTRPQNN